MQILIRFSAAALLILTVLWIETQLSQLSSIRGKLSGLVHHHDGATAHSSAEEGSSSWSFSVTPSASEPTAKKRPSMADLVPSPEQDRAASSQWTTDDMLGTKESVIDGVIVVGKLKRERSDWLRLELKEWKHAIYTRDDRRATLSAPKNKGKTTSVYLQYIIDHYHHLPATIVFLQNHRKPGHSEFSGGNIAAVTLLQRDFVARNGYANLRCSLRGNCDSIQPYRRAEEISSIEKELPAVWESFFNSTDVPENIATLYSGQFAVSRDQVLKRSRAEYENYQQWVMDTKLSDDDVENLMGYLWHVIFGQEAVYCPETQQCMDDVYGL
ncbi:hypothetical protein BO71DRAFT_404054 [Aspergillus ellipticus CBS 707.79]|uniref:Uncharacterized protein n=1 Tax=Aspergillus ellipticus CBS 707.79 TaxID=1448320 RepID=A0A319CSA3_9EURO|nr:hypothetical protein BO71DRAFT_404054 [Aspergillus ellipticus CBS 707.79]